ncbi:MAG: DUF89 family protein [Firmicutes bacterium]|nr:DUF89 family protein [Bacillota bacterium]
MNLNLDCIPCIANKAYKLSKEYLKDDEERFNFLKEVYKEISETSPTETAPSLSSKLLNILKSKINIDDLYLEEKTYFNEKLLNMLKDIEPNDLDLLTGLKYALAGNIIDFGAMDTVEDKTVKKVINKTLEAKIDMDLFKEFKDELKKANHISYVADNAGEIVFDSIFIKEIKNEHPTLDITFITRGEPVFNDVTTKDAYQVGINKYAKVIGNGTSIPGTDLNKIDKECKKALEKSDLIISKGQGNFETLFGSSLNIYYLFLCKCDMFTEKLKKDKFQPVFIHNREYATIKW